MWPLTTGEAKLLTLRHLGLVEVSKLVDAKRRWTLYISCRREGVKVVYNSGGRRYC